MRLVLDGDTLDLKDGGRVRLAGLNAPELGRDGARDEPFATAARDRLRALVAASGGRIRLKDAADPKDHYGRRLAYVFDRDGRGLGERLIQEGLAITVVMPPNLEYLDCHRAAEATARTRGLNLWTRFPTDPSSLAGNDAKGFTLVRARVERVSDSRRSIWLRLAGGISLYIDRADLPAFDAIDLKGLEGRDLEARGWLQPGRKGPRMRIRHPAALALR